MQKKYDGGSRIKYIEGWLNTNKQEAGCFQQPLASGSPAEETVHFKK